LALGLLLVSVLVSAEQCFAQPAPGDKAKAVDGKLQPFRVLYDRRVDFPLTGLAFSRDGKQLASLGATYAFGVQPQYRIVIASVATGKVVRELPMHTTLVNKFVFSPDGKVLYAGLNPRFTSGFGRGPLVAWDVETGKQLKEMAATAWDLSSDGKRLAIVENFVDEDPGFEGREPLPSTYTLQVLNTTTWQQVSRLHEKNAVMSALRFSPDGKTLALSVPNYSIRLWDWQAGKETLRFEATKLDEEAAKLWGPGKVNVIEYSPDGTLLATITEAPPDEHAVSLKIDLWDTSSGKLVRSLEGTKTRPTIVAFTPKGDRLAVAAYWNHFRLLDVGTGKLLKEMHRSGSADMAAALYRDGMTPEQQPGGAPVLERLWNLASGDDTRSGKTLENPQCVTFAPDDRTLAVGDHNGIIHLVDVALGKELRQFSDGDKTVSGVIFLEDGKLLCSQHVGGAIKLWDAGTGKLQPLRLAGAMPGNSLGPVASRDGKLAMGSHAGLVAIWGSYKERRPSLVRCSGGTELLQFTPDGKKLLACALTGNPGKVQVIDVAAAKVVGTIGAADVGTFGIVPEGPLVATWSRTSPAEWEKSIRLWDLSGAAHGDLAVTPAAYGGLRFTPDGRSLLVEQPDGIGVWDIATRKVRSQISGVGPIALSSNSRFVVTAGPGCLFVWDLTGGN
jgi:WD40 repeat protein